MQSAVSVYAPWHVRAAVRLAAWIAVEHGRFLLWLPVLMVAGAVAYDAPGVEPPLWLGALVFLVAAGSAGALIGRTLIAYALVCLAAFALGFAAAQFAAFRAAPLVDLPSRASIVLGTVRAVEMLPEGRRVLLEAPRLDGGAPLARMLRIRLRADDPARVATGDTLRVRALLQKPGPPAYPGAWDLQRDAFFAGIGGYGYALNPAERVAEAQPDGPLRQIQLLREAAAERLRTVLGGTVGSIAVALLTGTTSLMPEPDRAAFRDSGLAHLLSVSGLHMAIVMGAWFGVVRLLLVLSEHAALHWPTKQIAALVSVAAGFLFMLFTGAQVPIIRSFAMACLVALAVLAGRRAFSLRGLAIALALVVLIAPMEVLGPSLQMSFSAVLALIAGYALLRPMLSRLAGEGGALRWLGGHVAALALTSALAGTASLPFGAYHFGHVQIYYILANMIAVPITTVLIMPAGMLGLLLMPFGLDALALVPMGWGIAAILWVARTVAAWPEAVVSVPHMAPWGLALLSLGLAWLGLWRSRLRLAGIGMVLAGMASAVLVPPPDILVSADARLIGLRRGGELFLLQAPGASRFIRESWLNLAGISTWRTMPPCDGACPLQPLAGGPSALLLGPGSPAVCDGRLLISAEPLRPDCPGGPKIDRFTVWREGAHAVWLRPDGPRIVSDRAYRGERPWVAPIPTRTRTPPSAPLRPALDDIGGS